MREFDNVSLAFYNHAAKVSKLYSLLSSGSNLLYDIRHTDSSVSATTPPQKRYNSEKQAAIPTGYILLGLLITALAACLLYIGTLQQYFVADDFIFLQQLRFVQPHFADSFVYFGRDWGMGADFYRPLTRLLWAAEYSFFGENAPGWHLTGLLLYSLNSSLVFLLAWRLSRRLTVAIVSGFIFVAHPSHAETVSWVSNQSDLLVGIFSLVATLCYFQAVLPQRRPSRGRLMISYASALVFFFLALLSKESATAFFLIPLTADLIFGAGLFRRDPWGPRLYAWLRLLLRQLPFLALLLVYLSLRVNALGGVGGYNPDSATFVPLDVFARSYANWLLMPLGSDLLVPLLLAIAAVSATAFFILGSAWLSARLRDAARAWRSPLIRTAFFGICWLLLFLLPTITTPPSVRFVYLSTTGLSILAAALLTPMVASGWSLRHLSGPAHGKWAWSSAALVKLLVLAALLLTSTLSTLGQADYWLRAGQTAQSLLRQIHNLRPDLVNYSYIYAAALPEANEEALIFRTGFPQAIQLIYDNATIQGISVPSFPVVEQHLSQAYFVQYKDGSMVVRDDLVRALQERNTKIKKGVARPYLSWDFTTMPQSPPISPFAGWRLARGSGLTLNNNGLIVAAGSGAVLSSPPLRLPAPMLGDFQVSLRVASGGATTDKVLVVRWLVSTPAGDVERTSTPLDVKSDGKLHSYKIKPPDMTAFFYNDIVSRLRLDISSALPGVVIQQAALYRLP